MRVLAVRDIYIAGVTSLIEAASRRPQPGLLRALAAGVSLLAYMVSQEKRRCMHSNLRQVFPDRSMAELRSVARAAFRNFWLDIFHLAYYRRPDLVPPLPVIGEDYLRRASAEGKGILLWESNSFGFRNLAKLVLARRGYRLVQVHLENHFGALGGAGLQRSRFQEQVLRNRFEKFSKPWADEFIYLRTDGSLAPVRRLVRVLSHGGLAASTLDGTWGHGRIAIPFLGTQLYLRSGALSAARLTGSAVLPLWCYETSDGWRVEIHPPVPPDPEGRHASPELRNFAARFEELVRTHPEQFYRWRQLSFPANSTPQN